MIKGFKVVLAKFVVFALAAGLMGLLLVNTMLNPVHGGTEEYTAQFRHVTGLRVGDDVRIAGVRVGRVDSIDVVGDKAEITLEIASDQPIYDTTQLVMRYQNLIGQRYLALVQEGKQGNAIPAGGTIPLARTSPGFDLTELLNGFRPLFEVIQPDEVNQLASSMVQVLQGEAGSIESLLEQTGSLTNFLADRDQVYGEVVQNLTPVLDNLAGQGDELNATVRELQSLMKGLAAERESIGSSIDSMSTLITATAELLEEARDPAIVAVKRFRSTMEMFMENRKVFVEALGSFVGIAQGLGRVMSYENAVNIYICSMILDLAGQKVNLNLGSDDGPFSEVCT